MFRAARPCRSGGGRSQFWHDYTDGPSSPLFPFGHGLSYTSFSYDALRVAEGTTAAPTTVAVTITNTGARAGDEVVQLYVTDEIASVVRPFRALVGFVRVPLAPKESATVTFTIDPSRLAFYDSAMRFVCEPGEFTFAVGAGGIVQARAEAVQVTLDGGNALGRQGAAPDGCEQG